MAPRKSALLSVLSFRQQPQETPPPDVESAGVVRPDGEEFARPAPVPVRKSWKVPAALALAAAALTALAVMVSKDKTAGTYEQAREKEKEHAPQLFTDFKTRVNDVRRIAMRFKGQDFVIEKTPDGGWIMPDRHRYPVDVEKVRGVLLNAAALEVLERKTNDPEKLAALGLDDPEKKTSDAVRVQFFDDHGAALASFVAGKRRVGGGYALYVRREAETQAYLVKGEGWMRLDPGPDYWLNVERFRLDKDAIKTVSIRHKDDGVSDIEINREHGEARKFRLDASLPPGKEEDQSAVNDVAFGLGDTLSLRGVFPDSGAEVFAGSTGAVTATYTLFSGFSVTVETAKDKEGDYPARFRASAGEGATAEVKKAVEAYNKAAEGWLYLLSDESVKLITAGADKVSRAPEKKEGGAGGSGAQSPFVAPPASKMTPPVAVEPAKPAASDPAAAAEKLEVSAPAAAAAKPEVSAPAAAAEKPEISAPAAAEAKPEVSAPAATAEKPAVNPFAQPQPKPDASGFRPGAFEAPRAPEGRAEPQTNSAAGGAGSRSGEAAVNGEVEHIPGVSALTAGQAPAEEAGQGASPEGTNAAQGAVK